MPNLTQIGKWGDSFAIRLPKAIAREAGLAEGDSLLLDVKRDGSILLTPTRLKYELRDLVSGITKENRHAETDWGTRVGHESW